MLIMAAIFHSPCIALIITMIVAEVELGKSSVTYCVKPDEMENCSDPRCNTFCHNLTHYSFKTENFTTDNSTFLFLAGEHTFSRYIHLENVSNLKLSGVPENNGSNSSISVTVQCTNSSNSTGFSFRGITKLTIEWIEFVACSQLYTSSALEIKDAINLTMNNVVISNTNGTGLLIYNVYGDSHITDTTIRSSHGTSGRNFVLYCYNHDNSTVSNVLITKSNFLDGHKSGEPEYHHYHYTNYASGVYIHIGCETKLHITLDSVRVVGNKVDHGGAGGNVAIQYMSYSPIGDWLGTISILNSYIAHGYCNIGAGLYFNAFRILNGTYNDTSTQLGDTRNTNTHMDILTVKNTTFKANKAPYLGAGVYIRLRETQWPMLGKISFTDCQFIGHRLNQTYELGHGGVAVHIRSFQLPAYWRHTSPLFEVRFANCNFSDNSPQDRNNTEPSFMTQTHNGVLYIQGIDSVTLSECKIKDNNCSGIVAIQSFLLLHGLNIISNNSGIRGGGLVLCSRSMIQLHDDTTLEITGNNATEYGGGIYVESECDQDIPHCFFQVDNADATNATLNNTRVILNKNDALAGQAIYGGMVDKCVIFTNITQNYTTHESSRIFANVFDISMQEGNSIITSDPTAVCFCQNEIYTEDCKNNRSIYVSIVPGSYIKAYVMLLGQRNSPVPGIVKAHITCYGNTNLIHANCSIKPYQSVKETLQNTTQCTKLEFNVSSDDDTTGVLQLVVEGGDFEYSGIKYQTPTEIKLNIEKCPLGSKAENGYCESLLKQVPTKHITDEIVISNYPPVWIGYRKVAGNTTPSGNIIYHKFCPLGYCREVAKKIHINTTYEYFDQDKQCVENRTGLLCGGCKNGYSLGFGSSQCLRCSKHRHLAYFRVIGLIAVCAVVGVLLVILLTLLNLTVAEGTLNGLIFYANIIQVNLDIFFPPETHARPWTGFIAWLNLDFGITVCFYDGMDAYAKTWLQFIFPLYIWLISGGIVYFSWKYNRVARLAGKNSVKVLATLFLLSFGKLIRTVIAAAQYTNIKSYDGTINISVWLPDANIHFAHGQHIILLVVAAVAGITALLYAFILTVIQCLRRAPNNRMFGWVRRLKPLLDAYTGPYKDKYHFWTGLLLLVRIFLFNSFALNLTVGPKLNFALIIIVTTLLMIAIQPGIYRQQLVGLLESSLYVNLILFSTVMMFSLESYNQYKTIAAYLFGGWALLTFLGIITYHAYKQCFGAPKCRQLQMYWGKLWLQAHEEDDVIQPLVIQRGDSEDSEESDQEHIQEMVNPSWNTPHFREPLIESTK